MTPSLSDGLDQVLDEIAERVAAKVVERLRGGDPGMVDQAGSPLGNRRHCAAVRRRVRCGEPGASIVGRRYLLSPQALQDELGRTTRKCGGRESKGAQDVRAELQRALRAVGRE